MSTGAWRYVHASVAGTSHFASATPCQDANVAVELNAPWGEVVLVLAVADGAGSATFADVGSRLACEVLVPAVEASLQAYDSLAGLTDDDAHGWVARAAGQISEYAVTQSSTAREFATTLLLAVLGEGRSIFVQVGDGAIVVDDDGQYAPVFWPDEGEYANATYFVTDGGVRAHTQVRLVDRPILEVALLSDGLQRLALVYHTRTAHQPFFGPMFAQLRSFGAGRAENLQPALEGFLQLKAVNDRTDDDKTLILATRRTTSPADTKPTANAEAV